MPHSLKITWSTVLTASVKATIPAQSGYDEDLLKFSSSCTGKYQHFLDKEKAMSTLFLSFEATVTR